MVGASERERLQRKPGRKPAHRYRPIDVRLASTGVTRTRIRTRRPTVSFAIRAARTETAADTTTA